METIAQIYNSLVIVAGISSLTFFSLVLFNSERRSNVYLQLYMATNTAQIVAIYVGMHSHDYQMFYYWHIKVRLFLLAISTISSLLLAINTFSIQLKRLALVAVILEFFPIVMSFFMLFANNFDQNYAVTVDYLQLSGMFFRTNWQPGVFYFFIISCNTLAMLLMLFVLRGTIRDAMRPNKKSYRNRLIMLYFSPFVFPPALGILIGFFPTSMFSIFNVLPIVHGILNAVIYIFVYDNYIYMIPLSKTWIFNNIPEPIIILNMEDEFLDANPSALEQNGLDLQQSIGRKIEDVLPLYSMYFEEILYDAPNSANTQVTFPDGTFKHFDIQLSLISNDSNRPIGKVITFHDITKEYVKRQELAELGILHQEIENRFTHIPNYLELSDAISEALKLLFEKIDLTYAEITIPHFQQNEKYWYSDQAIESSTLSYIHQFLLKPTNQSSTKLPVVKQFNLPHKKAGRERAYIYIRRPLLDDDELIGAIHIFFPSSYGSSLGLSNKENAILEVFVFKLTQFLSTLLANMEHQTNIRLNERQQIARDMHDSVMQVLSSAMMISNATVRNNPKLPKDVKDNLLQLNDMMSHATHEMRTLLYELRPNAIMNLPFVDLMQSMLEASQLHTTARIRLRSSAFVEPEEVQKISLYRIVQEAVNNCIKHSHATNIVIEIKSSKKYGIILKVVDDGIGFSTEQSFFTHGLDILRERAVLINSELNISSDPSEGTSVTVMVPRPQRMNGV